MKNLVVVAHPIDSSFNYAIVDKVVETLKVKGEEVVVKDLNKMGFNPTLTAKEMGDIRSGNTPSDIKVEQDIIKECDNLIFVYPIWWTSMPAILKGYIDRIFAYGFAYAFNEQGGVDGLLKGKSVLNITTQGTPVEYYEASGMTKSLKQTIDSGIFEFCGMDVKEHIFLGGVPMIDETKGKEILESIASKL